MTSSPRGATFDKHFSDVSSICKVPDARYHLVPSSHPPAAAGPNGSASRRQDVVCGSPCFTPGVYRTDGWERKRGYIPLLACWHLLSPRRPLDGRFQGTGYRHSTHRPIVSSGLSVTSISRLHKDLSVRTSCSVYRGSAASVIRCESIRSRFIRLHLLEASPCILLLNDQGLCFTELLLSAGDLETSIVSAKPISSPPSDHASNHDRFSSKQLPINVALSVP